MPTLVSISPFIDLNTEFPDKVWITSHKPTRRYGCFGHQRVVGLAVFSKETLAVQFANNLEVDGMTVEEITFDEARDIAKGRPMPVVSIMLLDNIEQPQIHYVK